MTRVRITFHKGGRGGKSGSYRVTIPKQIVDSLGWCDGLELEVRIVDHEGRHAVLLFPVKDPREVCKKRAQC